MVYHFCIPSVGVKINHYIQISKIVLHIPTHCKTNFDVVDSHPTRWFLPLSTVQMKKFVNRTFHNFRNFRPDTHSFKCEKCVIYSQLSLCSQNANISIMFDFFLFFCCIFLKYIIKIMICESLCLWNAKISRTSHKSFFT